MMGKWIHAQLRSGAMFLCDENIVPVDDMLYILNAHEPMLAALKEIAESPHRYFEDKDGTYVLGVADGYRFCAKVAEAAIPNKEKRAKRLAQEPLPKGRDNGT